MMDNEKYSLRQRQKRKHSLGKNNECQGYASDNSSESLQNIQLTRVSKSSTHNSSSGKAKTKAAPLSKYRRKTANARERTRMREINSAFELLRHCVPTCISNEEAGNTNEKLTKITTLRLAMKYIGILSDALINPHEADFNFLYDCTQSKPKDQGFMNDLEDIDIDVDEEVPIEKPAKTKNSKIQKTPAAKGATSRKSTPAKHKQHKKQKLELAEALIASPIPALSQASPASNASSAYASLSSSDSSASPHSNSSYLFENTSHSNRNYGLAQSRQHNSMSDLSNLMLESDGESLNLSERCLSPLHSNHKPYAATNLYDCSPSDMPSLENPLELSLRLMDPVVTDSLRLSPVPAAPSTSCFSPLLSLEPFNTYDLFHSDFNEQAALDLFLT